MHLAEKKQKQKAASKTYKFVSYTMKSVDNIELDSNPAVPWGTQILFFVLFFFSLFYSSIFNLWDFVFKLPVLWS